MIRRKKIELETYFKAGSYARAASEALLNLMMVLQKTHHNNEASQVYKLFGRLNSRLDDSFCGDFEGTRGDEPISPFYSLKQWRDIEKGILPMPIYKKPSFR